MVRPIQIEKSRVESEPYLVWNAFVEIISESDSDDMTDVQSAAQFAFRYDAEVQNGGHLQFFENMNSSYPKDFRESIQTTIEALKIIGGKKQGKILTNALKQYLKKERRHPDTVEEFVEVEREDEFEDFDGDYYECSPDMNEYLEKFLKKHMNEFIELV